MKMSVKKVATHDGTERAQSDWQCVVRQTQKYEVRQNKKWNKNEKDKISPQVVVSNLSRHIDALLRFPTLVARLKWLWWDL